MGDIESNYYLSGNNSHHLVKCCRITKFSIKWVFVWALLSCVAILELILANKYKDNMHCKSFISPYLWLVISGSCGLVSNLICSFFAVLFFQTHTYKDYEDLFERKKHLVAIPLLVLSPWLATGSVMF